MYRHLPLTDRALATRAAELAEYASLTTGRFWEVHNALMRRDPSFDEAELEQIAAELDLPPSADRAPDAAEAADARVREPRIWMPERRRAHTYLFINGPVRRRWGRAALAEALGARWATFHPPR